MAHTPGPWTPCQGGSCQCGFIWDASKEIHVASVHGPEDLGQSWFGGDIAITEEEQRANALLVAAAPDMYGELKELADMTDDAINDGDPALIGAFRDAARLLVAKAEGHE